MLAALSSLDANCAGATSKTLRCYTAARKLLSRFEGDNALSRCADYDMARFEADIARAKTLVTTLAPEANGLLLAQLAEDRASHVGWTILKNYVCMYLVNHFANDDNRPSDTIHVRAFLVSEALVSVQSLFGNDRHHDICGRTTSIPDLNEPLWKAYLHITGKLDDAAVSTSVTFLPKSGGLGSRDIVVVAKAIADFQREASAAGAAVKAALPSKAGDVAYIVLPEATGPDKQLLDEHYPKAAKAYREFASWLASSAGK